MTPVVARTNKKLLSVVASAWLVSEIVLPYLCLAYLYALKPTPNIGFSLKIVKASLAESSLASDDTVLKKFVPSVS